MKLKGAFVSLCMVTASAALAVPFDTTTVGGTATVGSTGDYATLKAAANAFNALGAPFIQGSWKLEIQESLTEPDNVAFGNTIPEGSFLTVKPAAGKNVTVTFTKTTDNGGVSGNFIIGDNNLDDWTLFPMERFAIDGSNNGTTSRNLTLTNSIDIAFSTNTPLAIVGACDGITVKNTTLDNGSTSTLGAVGGMHLVGRVNSGVAYSPKNITIQNCDIRSTQTQGHGLLFRLSGTAPANMEASSGIKIIGNTIQGRLRGIFMDNGLQADITSNTITAGAVGAAVTGFLQPGIMVNNVRPTTGQVLNITGNTIFIKSANTFAGDYGPVAVNVASGGAATSGNVVNFVNNMVNFQFTNSATAATASNYCAFRGSSAITYNLLNNSINMPNFEKQTGLTPQRAAAFKLPETVSYTANIQNNIIRVDQAGAAAITVSGSGTPTITSNYNVIYRDKSNAYTAASGTVASPVNHLTLSDWQTAKSQDANSQVVDPTATTGSKWQPAAGNADLHFVPQNVKPVEIALVPRLATVPADIDGTPRDEQTVPGADEVLEHPASVNDWSVY